MKSTILLIIAILMLSSSAQTQILNKLQKEANKAINSKETQKAIQKEADKILKNKNSGNPFSADEAAAALKEALVSGSNKGTEFVSKVDGFYRNPDIRIPFPPEAKKVDEALRKVGMEKQADQVVLTLNRAAEDASGSAKDIFVSAITEMTIDDAIKIVKGDNTAGTKYLKSKTTKHLTEAFSPIIKTSLDKVDATKYWKEVMTFYNQLPFVEKINPDLEKYVTQKALDALFLMIGKEEMLIRKDPIARTTELLQKVFGKK